MFENKVAEFENSHISGGCVERCRRRWAIFQIKNPNMPEQAYQESCRQNMQPHSSSASEPASQNPAPPTVSC